MWIDHRWLVLVCFMGFCPAGAAADAKRPSPEAVLAGFAKNWDESLWQPKNVRGGYMRPLDDRGWQARMTALQQFVQIGSDAVPLLVQMLKSASAPERILAAQTLGYLAPDAPIDALLNAARHDRVPAVRLYAVDSLGMQGRAAKSIDWQALLAKEKNRDVQMHINYAQERNGEPVERSVVKSLRTWDRQTMNSAVLGKRAPDFRLSSAQVQTVRLADYRGKKAVVLVFIYGDT